MKGELHGEGNIFKVKEPVTKRRKPFAVGELQGEGTICRKSGSSVGSGTI